MTRFWLIAAVALGGASGALARWGLGAWVQRSFPSGDFPLGTLAANLLGCLVIGACYVWLVERAANPVLRMGIITGLIGALTTFSTYGLESLLLLEQRRYLAAGINLLGSVALGLIAIAAGMALARWL